jgi:hypothetical protein
MRHLQQGSGAVEVAVLRAFLRHGPAGSNEGGELALPEGQQQQAAGSGCVQRWSCQRRRHLEPEAQQRLQL